MTWARLDDRFHSHPKVRAVWFREPAALSVHAMALSYAADHGTNGDVPAWFVDGLLPSTDSRRRVLGALVDGGLWHKNGSGYTIHDFLDYNPSKKQIEQQRKANRTRQKRHRSVTP